MLDKWICAGVGCCSGVMLEMVVNEPAFSGETEMEQQRLIIDGLALRPANGDPPGIGGAGGSSDAESHADVVEPCAAGASARPLKRAKPSADADGPASDVALPPRLQTAAAVLDTRGCELLCGLLRWDPAQRLDCQAAQARMQQFSR